MDPKLQAYFDEHPQEAQTILETLCRQPSIAAENLGMDETADLVVSLLSATGFETEQLQVEGAPPAVYGELRGTGPFTLLLYNHYDVQPAVPLELWNSPPFEPTVREGKLYARGVSDNKGGIATRLAAVRALRAVYGELPITVRWIIEGEEEVGSPHFGALAERYADLLQADACLWEDGGFDPTGRPGMALGAKGLLYIQLDVQALEQDAHSGAAGTLPSAAWWLVQALATLRDREGRITIPGFYDDVLPPTPAQLDALANLSDTEALTKEMYRIDQFVDGLSGLALRERQAFAPTCNIAGLGSGYQGEGVKTVLPAQATCKIDCRLVPNQDPDDILAKIRAHLDAGGFTDIQITRLGGSAPVVTPMKHPFVQRMIALAESFEGRVPAVSPIMGGTLPLLDDLERYVGVPGLTAPGGAGYWGSGAHAPNENVRLEDLPRAVRFNCHVFLGLGA